MTPPATGPGAGYAPRVPYRPGRLGGKLAKAALVLSLALAAVPGATSPAWSSSRQLLTPAWPLAQFPPQVAQACRIWGTLQPQSWPAVDPAATYQVGNRYIRGANTYGNRSGDLPAEAIGTYREYDVNTRPTPKTPRDAERLVRNRYTGAVWYTGDHYTDFREIAGGC